jgi:hypothetical protein
MSGTMRSMTKRFRSDQRPNNLNTGVSRLRVSLAAITLPPDKNNESTATAESARAMRNAIDQQLSIDLAVGSR